MDRKILIFGGSVFVFAALLLGGNLHAATVPAKTKTDANGPYSDAMWHGDVNAVRTEIIQARDGFEAQMKSVRADSDISYSRLLQDLRSKLAIIKDDRRRQIVDRISSRMAQVHVNRFEALHRLAASLDDLYGRLRIRVAKAAQNGLDVSSARDVMSKMEAAQAKTHASLETLAAKTYFIALTNETTLTGDVNAAIDLLKTDSGAARDALIEERDAIKDAAMIVSRIPRIDDIQEIAPTGVQSSTLNEKQ